MRTVYFSLHTHTAALHTLDTGYCSVLCLLVRCSSLLLLADAAASSSSIEIEISVVVFVLKSNEMISLVVFIEKYCNSMKFPASFEIIRLIISGIFPSYEKQYQTIVVVVGKNRLIFLLFSSSSVVKSLCKLNPKPAEPPNVE